MTKLIDAFRNFSNTSKNDGKHKIINQVPCLFKKSTSHPQKHIKSHYFEILNHVYFLRTTTRGSHALSP